MKNIIKEFGDSLFYALISLICIFMFIVACTVIFSKSPTPYKQSTYNSNSYEKDEAPIISLNQNTLLVKKNAKGFSNSDETLKSLKDNNVYNVKQYDGLYVKGNIDTSKVGNYNVELIASNNYSLTTAGITISVIDDTNLY